MGFRAGRAEVVALVPQCWVALGAAWPPESGARGLGGPERGPGNVRHGWSPEQRPRRPQKEAQGPGAHQPGSRGRACSFSAPCLPRGPHGSQMPSFTSIHHRTLTSQTAQLPRVMFPAESAEGRVLRGGALVRCLFFFLNEKAHIVLSSSPQSQRLIRVYFSIVPRQAKAKHTPGGDGRQPGLGSPFSLAQSFQPAAGICLAWARGWQGAGGAW